MNLKYISVSMANCYFAEPHGMKHCYIHFFMLLDFKRALSFGEAQRGRRQPAWTFSSHPRRAAHPRSNKPVATIQLPATRTAILVHGG
jgi:hypothetical protein